MAVILCLKLDQIDFKQNLSCRKCRNSLKLATLLFTTIIRDNLSFKLHQELESMGELDNTYIFYTSDHGYHLGQFGLVKGKAFAFDVDTKIPYIVRGPKVRAGSIYHQPVLNIDLAPTFLDIGGVAHPAHMDGKSIVPLFHERYVYSYGNCYSY